MDRKVHSTLEDQGFQRGYYARACHEVSRAVKPFLQIPAVHQQPQMGALMSRNPLDNTEKLKDRVEDFTSRAKDKASQWTNTASETADQQRENAAAGLK